MIKGVFAINFRKLLLFLFVFVYLFTSTLSPALAALNYTYDANGNATTDGTNCYEYNDANQLKKVKLCSNNQTIAEYIYDYQGNRITKKLYNSGSLQKTVYSPSDAFETTKLASNGATTNVSYYFVNDELAAKKNSDGSKNYFLNDHLGSIGIMTNSAGTTIETTQYYPYGLVRAGGTKNKFLYTGQENDPETGLDYYNFRYYNSQLGRFIQPDDQLQTPYDPQSLNNYSYVKNNPIKYTDPTGHYLETALDIGFLAFDLNELRNDPGNLWNWAALGGDIAGTALPVVTGVGLGIRTVGHTGDAMKLVRASGKYGETQLAKEIGNLGKKLFETPIGRRIVDAYNPATRTIYEAKSGRVNLTKFVKNQIQKDKFLTLDRETRVSSAQWRFYKSPVTGKIGPSKPLKNYLLNNNFYTKDGIRYYFGR